MFQASSMENKDMFAEEHSVTPILPRKGVSEKLQIFVPRG